VSPAHHFEQSRMGNLYRLSEIGLQCYLDCGHCYQSRASPLGYYARSMNPSKPLLRCVGLPIADTSRPGTSVHSENALRARVMPV